MHPYINVFSLQIPSFGLMMLVGMIAAFILLLYIRRYQPYNDDDLSGMAIVAILMGFLGSKLMYWIVEWDQVVADPHFLLESLRSGFVFYGALILGSVGIWLYTKYKKQSMLAYADIVMPAFILGQGFGRIGCFLAGCCYGCHTDSCLGVNYPSNMTAALGNSRLPTQLFESAFCMLFCIALVMVLKKEKRYGVTTGVYLIGYAIWRFFIEFYRDDDRGTVGILSTSQFIAIFALIIGIIVLIFALKGKTPLCEELIQQVAEEYKKQGRESALSAIFIKVADIDGTEETDEPQDNGEAPDAVDNSVTDGAEKEVTEPAETENVAESVCECATANDAVKDDSVNEKTENTSENISEDATAEETVLKTAEDQSAETETEPSANTTEQA